MATPPIAVGWRAVMLDRYLAALIYLPSFLFRGQAGRLHRSKRAGPMLR